MEGDIGSLILGLVLVAGSMLLFLLKINRYKSANIFYPGYYTDYSTLILTFFGGL